MNIKKIAGEILRVSTSHAVNQMKKNIDPNGPAEFQQRQDAAEIALVKILEDFKAGIITEVESKLKK